MAISDNYVPLKELGNGTTVDFSDIWAVISASFLRVFLEDVVTGVQVLQVEGPDYTLVFDGGFTVTFLVAPTSANFVVISRDVAETQIVPYRTSKGFQGSVQEDSFDKLTAIDQDQSDEIARSLKFQLGSTFVGGLPAPIDDLFVGWNSTTGAQKNSVKTITQVESAVDSVAALVAGSGVLVSADDTTAGFLNGKLVAGNNVSFVENSPGNNESLTINVGTDLVNDTSPQLGAALDTNSFAINESAGAAVSSATETDIFGGDDGNTLHITGTTTIVDFTDASSVGQWRKIIFDGVLTLTHGSGITLPGSANITTAAGDYAFVYADAVGAFTVLYFRADGTAISGSDVVAIIAGLAAGAVGTYMAAGKNTSSVNHDFGDTISGADLDPTSFNLNLSATVPSGTWRCMGFSNNATNISSATIWLRIS